MNRTIIIIWLFLLSSTIFAQWKWQNPLPQGNFLNDIQLISQDTFWIIGDEGTILHTTDGGNEWELNQIIPKYDLNSIFLFSNEEGFIAGDYGKIFKTSNGGISWEECNTPDDHDLWDLHFINKDTGWACGYWGSLFHTIDNGETWTEINTPYNQSFNSIFFHDANNAWLACGELDGYSNHGLLLNSSNGGLDWDTSYYNMDYFMNKVSFFDSQNGIALGFNYQWQGIILKTNDAGNSWTQCFADTWYYFSDVWFANTDTIYVVGHIFKNDSPSIILKTTNGGQIWEVQMDSIPSILKGIHGIPPDNLVTIGKAGQIYSTPNGGQNWDLISSGYYGKISDIIMLDDYKGWSVGNNGMILHTSDGGNHWVAQNSNTDVDLKTVYFNDELLGFAAGEYEIHKTSDGGNTWSLAKGDCPEVLNSIFISSQYTAWVVGNNGYVLKTQNGGEDWTQKDIGYNNSLEDVFFANTAVGWIVGRDGLILKTTNTGNDWFRQADSIAGDGLLFSVHFINSLEGWIAGWYNLILHTSDGGTNWENQNQFFDGTSDYTFGLRDIYFHDSQNGWAAGYGLGPHPIIMGTNDGGSNWEELDCPTGGLLYGVHFVNQNTGWVVGSNATILHTNCGGGVGIDIPKTATKNNALSSYPNPFSSSTTFQYWLSESSYIELIIYNAEGKIIELVIDQMMPQNTHSYTWNAEEYPAGIYYAVIRTDGDISVVKMIKTN